MSKLNMFIPITKMDIENRLVFGIATAEKKDRANEICDYATTKPFYEAWSGEISKATGGKSLGNIRAMHGKIAAGKVTKIEFNDTDKQIEICAKVVDDGEWNKCLEGVYTGFSQGGSYAKTWKDPDDKTLTRYTAKPGEVSLVDWPCLPEATFAAIKADGTQIELRKFTSVVTPPTDDETMAKALEMAKELDLAKAEADRQSDLRPVALTMLDKARDMLVAERIEKAKKKPEEDVDGKDGDGKNADNDPERDGNKVKDKDKGKGAAKPKAKKFVEPTGPFWKCDCPDHEHLNKADAVTCMKHSAAEELAKDVTSPLTAALDGLEKAIDDKDEQKILVVDFVKGWKAGAEIPADIGEAMLKVFPELKATDLDKGTADAVMTKLQVAMAAPVVKKDFTDEQRKEAAKSGAAMPDGSFPIEDKSDLDNAIKAYGRAKNKAAAKRHIVRRARALDATSDLPDGWVGKPASKAVEGEDLKKVANYDTISNMLYLLGALERAEESMECMAVVSYYDQKGTQVDVPKAINDRFGALLIEFGDITASVLDHLLAAMGEEERGEALEQMIQIGSLIKAVRSKSDKTRVQQMHDLSSEMGADCGGDDVDKAAGQDGLHKSVVIENKALRKQIDDMIPRVETLIAKVAALEAKPAPAKAVVRVTKQGDNGEISPEVASLATELDKLTPHERSVQLMKLALRNPTAVVPDNLKA